MSRSRKAPIWTEGYKGAYRGIKKRHANKRVRAAKNVADGKSFKKITESWDIVDFKIHDDKNPKAGRK